MVAPVYTYSGDPSSSVIDQIRFLVQDTNITAALLSDQEITYLSTKWKNVFMAAAEAADVIGSKYVSYADKTVGPLRIRKSDLSQRYYDLGKSLRQRASRNTGALATLTATVRDPMFKIGMNDTTSANTMPLTGNPL